MKRKINLLNILFWIFAVALIIMLLTRIFGNSATDMQIFIGVLGIFFTSITDLYCRVGRIESNMIISFTKVRNDIKQIKNLIEKNEVIRCTKTRK